MLLLGKGFQRVGVLCLWLDQAVWRRKNIAGLFFHALLKHCFCCHACAHVTYQEEAREEIVEEAAEQGFVVEDMAGEILVDPVEESAAP